MLRIRFYLVDRKSINDDWTDHWRKLRTRNRERIWIVRRKKIKHNRNNSNIGNNNNNSQPNKNNELTCTDELSRRSRPDHLFESSQTLYNKSTKCRCFFLVVVLWFWHIHTSRELIRFCRSSFNWVRLRDYDQKSSFGTVSRWHGHWTATYRGSRFSVVADWLVEFRRGYWRHAVCFIHSVRFRSLLLLLSTMYQA